MFEFDFEKEKEKEKNSQEKQKSYNNPLSDGIPRTYAISGPNFGDFKVVRVQSNGDHKRITFFSSYC